MKVTFVVNIFFFFSSNYKKKNESIKSNMTPYLQDLTLPDGAAFK